MLRLLTAIDTLLSLLTSIMTRSETIPSIYDTESAWWSMIVKRHNQFDNWT
jgi:hypothetical protein